VSRPTGVGVRNATHTSFGRRSVDWELKGVPIRIELGARELASGRATLARRDDRTGSSVPLQGALPFRVWGHPWLPILVTATIVAVLIAMAFDDSTRVSLLQSLLAWVVILGAYGVHRAVEQRDAARPPEPEVAPAIG
jgi:hypothetical protein